MDWKWVELPGMPRASCPRLSSAIGTLKNGGGTAMDPMKFGVAFANIGSFVDPDEAIRLAQAAEAAGFESIWTVDHVVVPAGYQSKYPYDPSGRPPSRGRAGFSRSAE